MKKENKMKKTGILLAMIVMAASGVVHAVDYTKSDAATADWNAAAWSPAPGTWTSSDRAFITGGTVNWTPGSHADSTTLNKVEVKASAGGTTLNINSYLRTWAGFVMNWNNTGTATINHSADEYRLVGNAVYDSTIGWKGADNTAIYNLTGTGVVKTPGTLYIGRESTGTMNINGGSYNAWGSGKRTYLGYAANGTGTVNLQSGVFQQDGDNYLGVGYLGTGTFDQTGGEMKLLNGADLWIAVNSGSSGLYTISGGSIDNQSGWAAVGDGGTFEVDGSGATSIDLRSLDVKAGSAFRINLDGSGSTLVEAGVGVGINGTLELDTISGFSGTIGDTYDLFWSNTGAIDTNSMTFSVLSGSTDFDLSVVSDGGSGEFLRATVIPEPATLGLVALFGGVTLWIRRTFMI